jgi:hypothetical protein
MFTEALMTSTLLRKMMMKQTKKKKTLKRKMKSQSWNLSMLTQASLTKKASSSMDHVIFAEACNSASVASRTTNPLIRSKPPVSFWVFVCFLLVTFREIFCAECLEKEFKEDIFSIIKTHTAWFTPCKRRVCRCLHCIHRLENSDPVPQFTDPIQEAQYKFKTYSDYKIKKMLELNNLLIVKIEAGKGRLPKEKLDLYKFTLQKNLQLLIGLVKRQRVEVEEYAKSRGLLSSSTETEAKYNAIGEDFVSKLDQVAKKLKIQSIESKNDEIQKFN